MQCNASDLLEVLTIVSQYEKDSYMYSFKGVLYIDGLAAHRKMSQYERTRLNVLGFETGEKYGIRQIVIKTKQNNSKKG